MNHFSNRIFWRPSRFVVVAMTLLCIAAIFVPALTAQTASAGAVIGNQATATYNDAQGVSRQAFSNLVQTTVSQVYSGTLGNTQSRYATVGTQVVFPHTYTNNGNGSDTVTIGYNTPTAGFTNPAIYMDANGDGVPDNTANINNSAFVLAPNQVLKFVVVGTLGTAAGTTETVKVTAVSAGGGTVINNPNTDTISKTTNAAIAVTKTMSASSGVGGNVVGVTLTYTNTGNSTATAVVIGDPLGSTTTAFAYVANQAKWNGTSFTDATPPSGLTWAVTGNTPTATIASVAPGVTGTVTFNVTVGASVTIGGTINNTANFAYNDGVGPIAAMNTNTVPFTIQQNAAVTWTAGDAGDFTAGNPATDNLGAQTFNQGGVVTFTDTVTNSGNGFDTLNITYNSSSFPAGTAFEFFHADGLTPLTESNGDGIIDVGPVAAGATATIKVKAILPASAILGATWQVNVVATSTASTANNFSTAFATIIDKVTATVATSTVDLTVTNFASGSGPSPVGKGSGIASGITSTVNPGAQVIFPFYVQNTSLQATTNADSYALTVQSTTAIGTVTVPYAGVSAVPTGWTAIFHQASGTSCPAAYAAQSSPITSTGALTAANSGVAASSYQLFCLEVDVPAGYVGGTNNFLVQALSSSTAAIDQMQFAVAVNTIHLVTVTPNQSGQVYAGTTVAYKHQITNGGNSAESVVFPAGTAVAFNPALSGWTATVYQDSNSNGVLDGTDTLVVPGPTTFPLAIGQSIVVFVKIQASPAASAGDSTVSTLTITYAGSSSSSADDTTAVIAGQIKLLKSQFVDNGCTKTAGTFTTAIAPVPSGQCIIYQIQATNSGTTNVTGVTFADGAPAFTTYLGGYTTTNTSTCSLTGGAVTVVGGTTTPFAAAFIGSMIPSCTATITFEVKLN